MTIAYFICLTICASVGMAATTAAWEDNFWLKQNFNK